DGSRFVIRRSTGGRGRDVGIDELQAVATMGCVRLVGKAGLVQDRIHEVARRIAGKRSSRPIRTVGSRGKAHYQDSRLRIAKAGHGLAPVVPIQVSAPFFARNFLAVFNQPRTTSTGNDFAIEDPQPAW